MNGGAVMIWMISFALSLVLAPLLPGIVNKVKAFFAGRRGPSLFQLYVDLAKLLRKEGVFSATAGGFLQLAPSVSLGSLLLAAALLPHGLVRSPLGFGGDAVLFFYLLGTARFATVLGALDTGSSFEGMGSSREMQFSALTEGAIFGVIGFVAVFTGNAGFSMLPAAGGGEWWSAHAVSLLLAAAAFFVVLLAENCRVPFDDPETHLELTMIHEAMILDYAGPDLALILYGASLKFWMFATVLMMLILPWNISGGWLGMIGCTAGVLVTAAVVGAVESSMARYRFLKVPRMLVGALAVALLGIFFRLVFEGGVQ